MAFSSSSSSSGGFSSSSSQTMSFSSSSGPGAPYNLHVTIPSGITEGCTYRSTNNRDNITYAWDWDGPTADWDFEYRVQYPSLPQESSSSPSSTEYDLNWTNIGNSQTVTVSIAVAAPVIFQVRATYKLFPPKDPTAPGVFTFTKDWSLPATVTGLVCTTPPGVYDGAVRYNVVAPENTTFEWNATTSYDFKVAKVFNPNPAPGDGFGSRTAAYGNYLVCANSDSEGEIVVFFRDAAGQWDGGTSLGSHPGTAIAITLNSDTHYIARATTGGVKIWRRTGTNSWSGPVIPAVVNPGTAVMDMNGDYLVVGSYGLRTFWVYRRTGTNIWTSGVALSTVSTDGCPGAGRPIQWILSISITGSYISIGLGNRDYATYPTGVEVWRQTGLDSWGGQSWILECTATSGTWPPPMSVSMPSSTNLWLAWVQKGNVFIYERTDTNGWTLRFTGSPFLYYQVVAVSSWIDPTGSTLYALFQTGPFAPYFGQCYIQKYTRSGSTWTAGTLTVLTEVPAVAYASGDESDARRWYNGVVSDTEKGTTTGLVLCRMTEPDYIYRTTESGPFTDLGTTRTVTVSAGLGPQRFEVRGYTGYNYSPQAKIEWTNLPEESSSSSSLNSSSSSPSTFSSSSSLSSLSSSSPLKSSSSSQSSVSSTSSSSESSVSSSSESTSSISSASSLSSSSESSVSSSSTSSDYGHIDPPYDLGVTANPALRQLTITWDWTNYDPHHPGRVPTGFIVERQINSGDFTILTYSVPPAGRSYTDTLTEDQALEVFGVGVQLAYRVRAYWIG